MAKVIVSFKAKEMDLYELVKSQGDQSNFIKDALKFYIASKNAGAPAIETEAIRKRKDKTEEIEDILAGL